MNFIYHSEVSIPQGMVSVQGELWVPENANGIILFAHGSGSSRHSTRNKQVASYLHTKKFGTLLFDLLTVEEDFEYSNRFDIGLLTTRLVNTTLWLEGLDILKGKKIGYFGASTGAASALQAAARLPQIGAVVSRGGRPDLAMDILPLVKAPTLLIVGELDTGVINLNKLAQQKLACTNEMVLVRGATHLFEEGGKMEEVAELAGNWFKKYLSAVAAYE